MNEGKGRRIWDMLPFLVIFGFFVLIDVLALFVTGKFEAVGVTSFENSNDPLNLVFFFLTLLLFTGIILFLSRFGIRVVHVIFLGAVGMLSFYVFDILLTMVISEIVSFGLSIVATSVLILAIIKYPEWCVVDACSILMGVGSIATFGVSLSVRLVIVLLTGMAVYDAISVYVTRHMIDLADTVLKLKIPVMLVVPRIRNYSMIRETRGLKERLKKMRNGRRSSLGLETSCSREF